MSEIGYIKLHRALNSWGWKDDSNMVALWVHLLLNANYEPSEYRGHKIEKGQLVIGREALSKKVGISERSVRTCLDRLKKGGEIRIKTTNKFSVLTIVKWDDYQSSDQQTTSHASGERPASVRPPTTSKEAKKKEDKNILLPAQNVQVKTNTKKSKRGTRLPEDWELSSEYGKTLMDRYRLDADFLIKQETKFKNYWLAKTGRDATKMDWERTFDNWVMNAMEYGK